MDFLRCSATFDRSSLRNNRLRSSSERRLLFAGSLGLTGSLASFPLLGVMGLLLGNPLLLGVLGVVAGVTGVANPSLLLP